MSIQVEAVFQEGVFRPLSPVVLEEGQKVSLAIEPTVHGEAEPAYTELPSWCDIFEGLTDEEIAEIEKIILDRSNFMRPPSEDL